MTDVRWLLFDVGGVLEIVDDAGWPEEFRRRWAARLGLSVGQFSACVESADLPDATTQSGVKDEFWTRYGAAVGADGKLLAQMRDDFWGAYCGQANTTLIRFLQAIKGRVGLAILSNSTDGARREEERRYGFSVLFDPICYSHEIGKNKPDPGAFHAALAAMDAEPNHVAFIDNVATHVAAANALGIRGLHHADNTSTIKAIIAMLPPGDRPTPRL